VKRIPRHSEVRVTGLDGETRIGRGDGLAAAVRALGRNRPDGNTAPPREDRWRLTPLGAAYLAGLRDGECRR
jgi:hypothetical protein